MPNQSFGAAGGGNFLRILGLAYLIKAIRRRRAERRPGPAGAAD